MNAMMMGARRGVLDYVSSEAVQQLEDRLNTLRILRGGANILPPPLAGMYGAGIYSIMSGVEHMQDGIKASAQVIIAMSELTGRGIAMNPLKVLEFWRNYGI